MLSFRWQSSQGVVLYEDCRQHQAAVIGAASDDRVQLPGFVITSFTLERHLHHIRDPRERVEGWARSFYFCFLSGSCSGPPSEFPMLVLHQAAKVLKSSGSMAGSVGAGKLEDADSPENLLVKPENGDSAGGSYGGWSAFDN